MDRVRTFCDHLRNRLLASIRESPALKKPDKSVLEALWVRSTVRTQTVDNYPGHSAFARELGISRNQLTASLYRLEQKGFLKPTGSPTHPSQLAFLLNAMLLEAAYDETTGTEGNPF